MYSSKYTSPPLGASLFITIRAFPCYDPIGLVYSIHDSTEVAINKMVEASQRMLNVNRQVSHGGFGIIFAISSSSPLLI
jgi:hypothetical protein